MIKTTSALRFMIALCLIMALISCKKGDSSRPPLLTPVKTPKGTSLGTAVTKTIGTGGGSITSADGKITVTVPAGAVSASTVFSIQPVSSTLPGREDHPSYRLLPEGVNFAKRIGLTYHYNESDISGSKDDLLAACYQTAEGNWKVVASSLNKDNKTVNLTTDHFSDWTIFHMMELVVNKPVITVHEDAELEVTGFALTADDLLGLDETSGSVKWAGNWEVLSGGGLVAAKKDSMFRATYKPPSPVVNGSKAEVKVELKGNITIPDSSAAGGRRSFSQMMLIAEISLVNDIYMTGSFDGQPIVATDAEVFYSGGQMVINASMSTDTSTINYSLQVAGSGSGKYPCGSLLIPGNSDVSVSGSIQQQPVSYIASYIACGPPSHLEYSSGKVEIGNWGPVGSYIMGTFEGKLYKLPANECSPPGKVLSVQFRARRVL